MIDLFQQYSPKKVLETLAPLLTEERKQKIFQMVEKRIGSVEIAIESPTDLHNGLAIVRTAEALGLKTVHLIATEWAKGQGKATTSGAVRWMHVQSHREMKSFSKEVEERGMLLAGATACASHTLDSLPTNRPICLLFGNEHRGLSKEALDACNLTFSIPMFGMVESYNLSVAAAISLHHLLSRVRKGMEGNLSESEKEKERALCYARSIGMHKSLLLLAKEPQH